MIDPTVLLPFADSLSLRLAAGALLGPIFGSFATMLAYRVPRGLSIIRPGSRCPHCGHGLGPHDLIPLLSYVLARGRCRYCHVPIGARYIRIEIAVTLLFMGIFAIMGFTFATGLALIGAVAGIAYAMHKTE